MKTCSCNAPGSLTQCFDIILIKSPSLVFCYFLFYIASPSSCVLCENVCFPCLVFPDLVHLCSLVSSFFLITSFFLLCVLKTPVSCSPCCDLPHVVCSVCFLVPCTVCISGFCPHIICLLYFLASLQH